jgi:hypothetical protein
MAKHKVNCRQFPTPIPPRGSEVAHSRQIRNSLSHLTMLHTRKSALAYVLAFAFAARNSRMLVRKSISWHSIGPSVAARNACWTGYSRWNNPFVARATTNSIPLVTPPQHPRKISTRKKSILLTRRSIARILAVAYKKTKQNKHSGVSRLESFTARWCLVPISVRKYGNNCDWWSR